MSSSSTLAVDTPARTYRPGDNAVWWVLAYVALLPLPGPAEAVLAAVRQRRPDAGSVR